jgi:hypothetical protein
MARNKNKFKGQKLSGHFAALPTHILQSNEYAALRPFELKLLIDLFGQYRGSNNGDFTAAWSIMKKRGWHSRGTLSKSIKGLLEKGFILKTRQGFLNVCSLFAVTWLGVDECKGKLDTHFSSIPANAWRKNKIASTVCDIANT